MTHAAQRLEDRENTMSYCLWTKPSMKSKSKPTKRCGLTKAEARKAMSRARSSGKGAGIYRKGKSASRKGRGSRRSRRGRR